MNKPILRTLKCVIPSQDASVTSAIGPLLGQYGANIKDFCNKFNDFTKKYDENINLLINIIIFKDKTLSFEVIQIVGSFLIFEEQFILEQEKFFDFQKQNEVQLVLLENFKDILQKNINKILYFFDINSNFFFFSEFLLYFLSKNSFNDYFSQINFIYDFYITGRYFPNRHIKKDIRKHLTKCFYKKNNELFKDFLLEIDDFINASKFKKKKSFFLQAGENEDKEESNEDSNKLKEDEGKTLFEKNVKYFDLERLEEYKYKDQIKKKKKPKNVSRIVKMEKKDSDTIDSDKITKNLTQNVISEEEDFFFFYIPKTVNLSVLYKIVKFKHYFNKDIEQKILFRITASSILSMEIKIIDDIF